MSGIDSFIMRVKSERADGGLPSEFEYTIEMPTTISGSFRLETTKLIKERSKWFLDNVSSCARMMNVSSVLDSCQFGTWTKLNYFVRLSGKI